MPYILTLIFAGVPMFMMEVFYLFFILVSKIIEQFYKQ